MRASPPALARYSAVSLPAKPVAPYRTMSNSRCSVIGPTLPERLRQLDVLTQHVAGQKTGHHLVPDLGVLRAEHPVVLRWEVKEWMRACAVLRRRQAGLGQQLVPEPKRLTDRDAIVLVAVNDQHGGGYLADEAVRGVPFGQLGRHLARPPIGAIGGRPELIERPQAGVRDDRIEPVGVPGDPV